MPQGPGAPYGPAGAQPPAQPAPRTPDWAAMADDTARRDRRRRWLLIGGGVLATGAVAAIVATAVVSSGEDKASDKASHLPRPEKLPSESPTPEPTFSDVAPPAPPNPVDILASNKKDTAPISAGTLFPGVAADVHHHRYAKGATSATRSCASAAQGALPAVLTRNGCRQLFRATYRRDGVAVTVGIAVFDTKAAAGKAMDQAKPNITSLPGDGVPTFCRHADCRSSANTFGRYVYFTIAGYTSGRSVPGSDTKALRAGREISDYAFSRILARGNAQASAAASATGKPSAGPR
ncbi:hypothetical protein ACZ90_06415 [Streptomyces albus subsp. albus]|nr:hypothetical protein ACZ90_06415 [Streptomyces albus subsp. albus]